MGLGIRRMGLRCLQMTPMFVSFTVFCRPATRNCVTTIAGLERTTLRLNTSSEELSGKACFRRLRMATNFCPMYGTQVTRYISLALAEVHIRLEAWPA